MSLDEKQRQKQIYILSNICHSQRFVTYFPFVDQRIEDNELMGHSLSRLIFLKRPQFASVDPHSSD